MKVSEFVPKDNEYYQQMCKIFSDPRWEVTKNQTIKSSETQTLIFMLLKNEDIYVFCQINRFGIIMSKPTTQDDGDWRYTNAIKDTQAAISNTDGRDKCESI